MENLIKKLFAIQKTGYYQNIGEFRESDSLSLYDLQDDGIRHYNYVTSKRAFVKWSELTPQEISMLQKFVDANYPDHITITKNSYMVNFTNTVTNETMVCDMKDQKFTKVYADGRKRDVTYPNTFFKGIKGSLLLDKMPSEGHFGKLMEIIVQKEYRCSNFGTFLVRMFDNIHLESYVAAGVKFNNRISVPYNYFDKDVRKHLEAHDVRYDTQTQTFFMDKDIARSVFTYIKDKEDFVEIYGYLANQMRHIVSLVRDYNYNVRSLLQYMESRNWKSLPESTKKVTLWHNPRPYDYMHDLPGYLYDYARMASTVFNSELIDRQTLAVDAEDNNTDFPKYPKDVRRAHDYVQGIYQVYQQKFDELEFASRVNPKWEYEKGDYCVVNPQTTNEIKDEGSTLKHCVGIYIPRVCRGETIIVFLRDKNARNVPLLTVEIYGSRINQVKGLSNRHPNYTERAFITEYAKVKKLTYSG